MGVIYLFIYLFINWIILFYYNIILFTLFFLLLLFLLRSSCVFFYSSLSSLFYITPLFLSLLPSSSFIHHTLLLSLSLYLSFPYLFIIIISIQILLFYLHLSTYPPTYSLATHLTLLLTHSLSLSHHHHIIIYIPSYSTFLNPSISIIIQQPPFIYYSLPFLFLLLYSSSFSTLYLSTLSLSHSLSFLPSSHFLFNSKHSFPSCIFYWKYPMLPSLVCVFVRARHQCTTTPLPLSSSPSHTLNTQNHPRYRPTPSAYSLYLLPSCVCMFICIYTLSTCALTQSVCVSVCRVYNPCSNHWNCHSVCPCAPPPSPRSTVYLPLTIHAPLCVRTILCARSQYLCACMCVRVFPTMRIANDEQQHHTYPAFHPMPCVLHHILLRASRHHCRTHPPTTCTVAPGTRRPSSSTVILCTLHRYLPLHHQRSIHKQLQRVSLRVRVWVHHRSLCGESEREWEMVRRA